jgi:hypothetical protein
MKLGEKTCYTLQIITENEKRKSMGFQRKVICKWWFSTSYIYNIYIYKYIYMYTCVYIYIGWYVGIFISPTLGLKLPNYEDPSAPKLEKTHRADAFHGPLGSSGPKPPLIGKTPGGS